MESYPAMWTLRSLSLSAGERSNTAGADMNATVFAIDHHALALDIRTEHSLGCTLRVTYVVPEHRALAADFALCHSPPLVFDDWAIIPQRL